MEHNTNRLNFPLMVDNHLKVTPRPHSIYFDSYTLPNNKANKSTPSMKTKSHAGATKTDIEASLGSIYYTIHNSLQNKNMQRHLKQSSSQPHIDIEKAEHAKTDENNKNNDNNISKNSKTNKSSNTNNTSNIKSKSKSNNINQNKGSRYNSSIYNKFKFNNYSNNKSNNNNYRANTLNYKPTTTKHRTFKSTITAGAAETKRNKNSTAASMSHEVNHHFAPRIKSIPLATIKCERKHRQALAHTIHPYEVQQREAEVMRQKRILQEMLQEHQILETNRRSIKQEIQSMKTYINEIREKLDRSLLKLGEKRTVYSLSGKRNRPIGGSNVTSKPAQNSNSCNAAATATTRTNNQPLTGIRINRRLKK